MSAPTAEANLGLVHLCANRFRGRGIEYEELYSAGCIGLLKAVKAFDQNRGVQFSTYAVPVILGEIKRLFRDGGTVKVSRTLKEHAMQLQQLQESHLQYIASLLRIIWKILMTTLTMILRTRIWTRKNLKKKILLPQ